MKNPFSKLLVVLILCLTVAFVSCFAVACSSSQDEVDEDKVTTEDGEEEVDNQLYIVSYSAGVGEGTAPTASEGYKGDYITIAQNTFTHGDLAFLGWSDGTSIYQPGDTFVMRGVSVVLTAVWEERITLNFEFAEETDGTLALVSCKTTDSVVSIPTMNGGKYISRIAKGAFADCSTIVTLDLPSCLITIDEGALAGLINLKNLTVPFLGTSKNNPGAFGIAFGIDDYSSSYLANDYYIPYSLRNVSVMGGVIVAGAFENCTYIRDVSFLDGVTALPENLLNGAGVETVSIYSGVTSIAKTALNACDKDGVMTLKTISVMGGNQKFKSVEGVLFTKNEKTIIKVPAAIARLKYTIPNGVAEISDYAFEGVNANVALGEDMVKITKNAFNGYAGETITINAALNEIEAGAFAFAKNLKSFEVSEANDCFYYERGILYTENRDSLVCVPQNQQITEFTVSDDTRCIYAYAMYGLKSLSAIKISDNVHTIGECAFAATSVEILNIPYSVYNVGNGLISTGIVNFERASVPTGFNAGTLTVHYAVGNSQDGDWGYVLRNAADDTQNACLTSYSGTNSGTITIPGTVGGHSVKSIGSALWGVSGVTHVVIAESIGNINSFAFADCECLGNMNLGSTENGLNAIYFHDYAFAGVTIGSLSMNGVQYIGKYAFENATFNNGTVTINTSSLNIGKYAFAGSNIYAIDLTNSHMEIINEGTFYGASNLHSVVIGGSASEIGEKAFAGCSALESVDMDDSNNLFSIGKSAFENCTSLTTVTVNKNTNVLRERAFAGCTSLVEFIIPEDGQLLSYETEAFEGCSSLKTITLKAGTRLIGKGAFDGCYSLVIYTEDGGEPTDEMYVWEEGWSGECPIIWNSRENYVARDNSIYFFNAGNLYRLKNSEVTLIRYNGGVITNSIPYGATSYPLTMIGANAYAYSDVEEVVIPGGVKKIEAGAFKGASNLKSLTVNYMGSTSNKVPFGSLFGTEESEGTQKVVQKITKNNTTVTYTYYFPKSLASLTITNGVIEKGELAGMTMLMELNIASGVQIKAGAIVGLGNAVVKAAASTRPSNWSALWNEDQYPVVWSSATNNVADDGYTYQIVDGTLYRTWSYVNEIYAYNPTVSSVVIGSDVTAINGYAFVAGSYTEIDASASTHYVVNGGALFTADMLKLVAYPSAASGTTFIVPNSVERICDYAFFGATNLNEITLNDGLIDVGKCSFAGAGITQIEIPASVSYIGKYAFDGCTAMKFVVVASENELAIIDDGAFNGCKSLIAIGGLENALTTIGAWAFADCESMTSITIPASVADLGDYAFYNCSALTINCEASEAGNGWAKTWNHDSRLVNWEA